MGGLGAAAEARLGGGEGGVGAPGLGARYSWRSLSERLMGDWEPLRLPGRGNARESGGGTLVPRPLEEAL